jgi:hypothetical protein
MMRQRDAFFDPHLSEPSHLTVAHCDIVVVIAGIGAAAVMAFQAELQCCCVPEHWAAHF